MHKYQKKNTLFSGQAKPLGCTYKFPRVETVYTRSASGKATFQYGEESLALSPNTSSGSVGSRQLLGERESEDRHYKVIPH